MKRLVSATLVLAVAATSTAWAEDERPISVSGFADMSCGAWVASAGSEAGRAQYLAWFRGFITGVNFSQRDRQVELERLPSTETLVLYVDQYCRKNPLGTFPGAAFQLVRDLRPSSAGR